MVSKADNGFSTSIEILNRLYVHRSKCTLKVLNEVGKEEGFKVNINQVSYLGRCKLNRRCSSCFKLVGNQDSSPPMQATSAIPMARVFLCHPAWAFRSELY